MIALNTDHSRVVVGLDQGQQSGWGIAPERGRVVRHGLARNDAERIAVVRLALELAGGDPKRLYVMFEKHDHMPATRLTNADRKTERKGSRQAAPERSNETLIGMGKNYGVWIGMFVWIGVSRRHLLEVRPVTWRSRVHGVTRGDAKQPAIDWASRYLGEPITDHNQAEGVCITAYAALDGLMRHDAERTHARAVARGKREQARQGDLFAGPK